MTRIENPDEIWSRSFDEFEKRLGQNRNQKMLPIERCQKRGQALNGLWEAEQTMAGHDHLVYILSGFKWRHNFVLWGFVISGCDFLQTEK